MVYSALMVGHLHQQQGGAMVVQLHTAQPTTVSSGNTAMSSAGSSSQSSSNRASGKKGSSKKAPPAQQASHAGSSSAAASSLSVLGSLVPPHHLQVLEVAGVAFQNFDTAALRDTNASMLASVGIVLRFVLLAVSRNLLVQRLRASAGSAGWASTNASVAQLLSSTSMSLSNSSSMGASSSATSRELESGGPPAAVLALLAPCTLLWCELFALQPNMPGADAVLVSLWNTSWEIHQFAARRASGATGLQEGPQQQQQQEQEQAEVQSYLQYISQDSWYRSCGWS
jgi:hypothetical protein